MAPGPWGPPGVAKNYPESHEWVAWKFQDRRFGFFSGLWDKDGFPVFWTKLTGNMWSRGGSPAADGRVPGEEPTAQGVAMCPT